MLDKTSRKFLDYLDAQENDSFSYLDDRDFPPQFGERDAIFAMIRYLEALGYIEPISSTSGVRTGIRLSHKGIKRAEFKRQEILKYLEEKWIDFFALLISIAAFILSLIALLRQLQD